MRAYLVGGAVRDRLLGVGSHDNDYVVVGETPEGMSRRGFRPVGKDFPVFVHPGTGEEYALARTERKSGKGHQGFTFHCAPEVTLEEDLGRRDLTVNAMAMDADGNVIDPHGGRADLGGQLLRHVSGAFEEDPLRVLRVARLQARLGFGIAPETRQVMLMMVGRGDLSELSAERVWAEIQKGLGERRPSVMLRTLQDLRALGFVAPDLARVWEEPVGDADRLPWGTRGERAAAFADLCAQARLPPEAVLAGALCRTGKDSAESAVIAKATCAGLKAPRRFRRCAVAVARARDILDRPGEEEDCERILDLLETLDWRGDSSLLKDTLAMLEIEARAEGREGVREMARRAREADQVLKSERVLRQIRDLPEFTAETVRKARLRGLADARICR